MVTCVFESRRIFIESPVCDARYLVFYRYIDTIYFHILHQNIDCQHGLDLCALWILVIKPLYHFRNTLSAWHSFPDLCVFRITVYRTTLEHRLSAWPGSMFIMDLSNTTVGTTLENTL